MRLWSLVSVRNPLWRGVGFTLLAGVVAGTVGFVQFGPRFRGPKPEGAVADGNPIGRVGTYVEQLGQSRFLLKYESIVGQEAELQLKGVHGRLEEPDTLWLMVSPSARKAEEIWTLDGPMDIEARDPKGEVLQGKGRIEKREPGLRWNHGIWTGLSTLVWDDLRGKGKGRWTLPPGWRRELDGRFVVENKPVHWEATAEGALRTLDAQSLVATLGFTEGHLENVQARMEGGRIQSRTADLDPKTMHWGGPIQFQRDDGWNGTAESGEAPRPDEGGSIQLIDLQAFEAKRVIETGTEFIQSRGARWTPAGIRAEGDVKWDQPRDGERLVLRAPRVLIREAAVPSARASPTGRASAAPAWRCRRPAVSGGSRARSRDAESRAPSPRARAGATPPAGSSTVPSRPAPRRGANSGETGWSGMSPPGPSPVARPPGAACGTAWPDRRSSGSRT